MEHTDVSDNQIQQLLVMHNVWLPWQCFAGAVATDSELCSEMAADVLRKEGSAVDAAITALLCLGAVHPQSSGIGG